MTARITGSALLCVALSGCSAIVDHYSFTELDGGMPPEDAGPLDATVRMDGGNDAGFDAGQDAAVEIDGGDAGPADSGLPPPPCDSSSNLCGVLDICAGNNFTCAVLADRGRVVCWGSDINGRLGQGTPGAASPVPSVVLESPGVPLTGIAQVACETDHVCARDGVGVFCWGFGASGQIGNARADVNNATPAEARNRSGFFTTTVFTGGRQSCARMNDASMWCWGANGFGQVGSGQTLEDHLLMVEAIQYDGVDEVGIGDTFMCGRRGGDVICAGNNFVGNLGNGTNDNSVPVVDVVGIADAMRLVSGGAHSCVLRGTDRSVWCWGDNREHQLGRAGTPSSNTPVEVSLPSAATEIWAGQNHSCAKTDSAGVRCWGLNDEGQLGDATRNTAMAPVEASVDPAEVLQMALGFRHSCARMRNGSVQCWGRGDDGQLGSGSLTNSLIPVLVAPEP